MKLRKAQAKLERRLHAYAETIKKITGEGAFHKPGSMKKH